MPTKTRHAVRLFVVLGCVFAAAAVGWAAPPRSPDDASQTPVSLERSEPTDPAGRTEQIAILAGGCFWCTEAVFERMEGVNDVVSGYIGGHIKNPTYQQVCSKRSGHAEAVQIFFDPSKTSFEELLKVFFKIHDPTTLNRQGEDSGPQYRSSIFYQDEDQKLIAEQSIKKLDASGEYRRPIVTLLEPPAKFYVAEEYHQNYFRRNPNAAYCKYVVYNKVRKFNRTFGDKIKKDLK